MATTPPWYTEVPPEEGLRQGDILRGFRTYRLPKDSTGPDEHGAFKVEGMQGDWVVLTASCDADLDRTTHVLLAAVNPVTQATLGCSGETFDHRREALRQGKMKGKFLLAPFPEADPDLPLSYVEFRLQAFLPKSLVAAHPGRRIRMRQPVREKFGQWVGGGFADIGLEDEFLLDRFVDRLPDEEVLKAAEAGGEYS